MEPDYNSQLDYKGCAALYTRITRRKCSVTTYRKYVDTNPRVPQPNANSLPNKPLFTYGEVRDYWLAHPPKRPATNRVKDGRVRVRPGVWRVGDLFAVQVDRHVVKVETPEFPKGKRVRRWAVTVSPDSTDGALHVAHSLDEAAAWILERA